MVNIKRILLGILFFAPLLLFSGVNLGPLQPLSTSGIITEKVLDGASGSIKNFSLSFKEPYTGSLGQYTVLNIDGCSITDKYGYQLPVKNISFELPKGASVSSVRITNGRWQEIEGEFNLPPHPYPLPGGAREELGTGAREELGTGAREGSNLLLPGTFLDVGYTRMANTTIVSISVYPVQYNPRTKKALFLKEAEIEVSYGVETENIPQVLTPLASSGDYSAQFIDSTSIDSECIIITPAKYQEYANRLKTLHENQQLGSSIPTKVVTIEEIAANPYGDTGEPPLSPLPTSLCPEGDFTNHTDTTTYPNRNTRLYPRFNQRLAQKMLSFLLDCHDAPGYENPVGGTQVGYHSMHKLQYIVILGNANEVPPSDYVYSTVWGGADGIENWIPTDYFYSACGSGGISLTPHTGIGRIPVSRAEAEEIFTNLTITGLSTASRTITFQIPDTEDPSVIEAGMTVVLRSGLANGRWLDIQSVSISGPSGGYYTVTVTLRANRNNGEAWMTDPAIATGDRIDIIDTRQQMDDIITKLEQWVNARGTDDNWFRVISFAGGKYIPGAITKYENTTASFYSASLASLYRDELSCVEAINKIDDDPYYGDGYSYVAGLDVKKYFASDIKPDWSKYDEAFLKDDIESILQNSSQTGILYFAGSSGYLDTLTMEDNSISSSDILGYTGSTYNSFIISHTDVTAAFDEELWYGPTTGNISIGKASLLSPAAAFAFFGPARSAYFSLNWSRAEDGLLVHSQRYTNELTMEILKWYHRAKEGNVTLNEIVTKALGDYYSRNRGSNIYDFRTLVGFSLLGSPCIYIPPPATRYPDDFDEWENLPTAEPLDPDRVNSDYIPCYEVTDGGTKTVSVSYSAEGSVELKLIDPRYYTADDMQTGGTSGTYTTPPFKDVDITGREDTANGPGLYFVRVSQMEKGKTFYTKENRYYFEIVNTFTPSGDILVIDDDQPRRYTASTLSGYDGGWQWAYPDYEDYYTAALNVLGKSYKVWHVENKNGSGNSTGQGRHGEVTEAVLNAYKGEGKAVIWFTGNDWFSTILPNERTALQNFLQGGGKLFITGQDIGWDIGSTSFYQNVLRAERVQDDIRLFNIDGIAIDDLSKDLQNITITGGDGAKNQRWPSEINPQSGASPCLLYNPYGSGGGSRDGSGTAGIKYYNSQTGQAHVYFSFGFEAINNADAITNGRTSVMDKVLTWLGSPTSTGFFTATAGDGEVYLNWTNPNPSAYPGVLILCRETNGYPTTAPTNGTSYTVGQTIGDGTVIYVQSPGGTSYTHTGLTNGLTYYYMAYVFDASRTYVLLGMDYATPQEGGGPGTLPEPTNLTATSSQEGEKWVIDLSWIDNSSDEGGFEISRMVGTGGTWVDDYATVGPDTTSYRDDEGGAGLIPGVIYYYRVRAYRDDPGGRVYSAWSNVASAATSEIAAPTNLRAVGGEREVWLSWKNNSPGADGFEIEIWRSHITPLSPTHIRTPAGAVSYRDSLTTSPNLPDGRPYYYKIRPYKSGVEPEETWWSDIVWTIPVPSAFPAGEDPTNLQVLPGWNTVVIRFDDNTTNESSYWVELWKKVPNNTENPYSYSYLPAFEGTGARETVLTITTAGKYYLRLIAYHKYGYGFSRYATVSGGSGTYVSFEVAEGTDESGGGTAGTCFIATAAFGSPYQKDVEILRRFRDRHLITNRPGRAFVRWYYRHSPPLARYISRRVWAKIIVRGFLRPLAWFLRF